MAVKAWAARARCLLGGVVAWLAAGAAAPAAPTGPHDGGTIVWLGEEPTDLNPYLQPDPIRGAYERLTSRGLTDRGPDGTWVALLAAKVPDPRDGDVSTDLLTVTWKLRPGLLWSDGTPLTSDDLRFTWEVCRDPGDGCTRDQGFVDIDRVDTPDPQTIILHYRRPFFGYKGQFRPGILPRHSVDVGGRDVVAGWAWNHTLAPTAGPFTVLRWDPGSELVLYRNPHFYLAGRPWLHRINVDFKGDAPAAFEALIKGQGNLLAWLPAPDAKLLAQARARGFTLGDGQTASLNEIQFNLRDPTDVTRAHPILGDPAIRRALLTGIDVTAVLAGWNIPGLYDVRRMTSPVDLEPDYACHLPPVAFDADAARRMLDEAGWSPGPGGVREKSGRRLHLRLGTYTGADVDFGPAVAVLREQLRALGVEVEAQEVDRSVLFSDWFSGSPLYTGDFDIMFYDWQPDLAGIEHDFDSFYASASVPRAEQPDGRNVNGIADATLDDLLKQARTSLDPQARRGLYCRIAERVQNGLHAQEYTAQVPNWPISDRALRGWQQDERFGWFGQGVEDWYLQP